MLAVMVKRHMRAVRDALCEILQALEQIMATLKHGGLTDFGREVVKEMNHLGMIVDVAHVSDGTIDDVLDVSTAPIAASHSSCRALTNMPRNLTDDQIKRIAAKGGIVMINVGSLFLSQKTWDAFVAMAVDRQLAI